MSNSSQAMPAKGNFDDSSTESGAHEGKTSDPGCGKCKCASEGAYCERKHMELDRASKKWVIVALTFGFVVLAMGVILAVVISIKTTAPAQQHPILAIHPMYPGDPRQQYAGQRGPPTEATGATRKAFSLSELPFLSLEYIEQGDTLLLQWGRIGSGEEKQYYYHIESLYRDAAKHLTVVRLSSGHQLLVVPDNATLVDDKGSTLGVIDFRAAALNMEASPEPDGNESPGLLRRLVKYPNKPQGPPESFMDSYCRYGCGQLAVTFPYYYRPFFGYGYPLVGTESFFPGGYGGNPVTELAANGMMGGGAPNVVAGNTPTVAGSLPIGGGFGSPGSGGYAAAQGGQVFSNGLYSDESFGGAYAPAGAGSFSYGGL